VLYRLRQPSTRRTPLPPKATGHGETQNKLTRARSQPHRNHSFLLSRATDITRHRLRRARTAAGWPLADRLLARGFARELVSQTVTQQLDTSATGGSLSVSCGASGDDTV
jgi:hypothetical protein